MDKESHPSRLYKAFLDCFVAEGIKEIPFRLQEYHKAFYDILNEDPDLATIWQLSKKTNPYSGTLDEMMQWFQMCGLTSIDSLTNPTNIIILNLSKYHEKPSEKQIELARRIYDNYKILVA